MVTPLHQGMSRVTLMFLHLLSQLALAHLFNKECSNLKHTIVMCTI